MVVSWVSLMMVGLTYQSGILLGDRIETAPPQRYVIIEAETPLSELVSQLDSGVRLQSLGPLVTIVPHGCA